MRVGVVCASVVSAAAFQAAAAEAGIPPDFRAAFEARVPRHSFAVITEPGIPTVPVHGLDGKQVEAYYSIDVKRGAWQPSQGLFDVNQAAVDHLDVGEVMEVVDVTFKDGDNRIDLRMVSLDAHEVFRAGGRSGREPVSTNLKFFLPFPPSGAWDLGRAVAYIETYVRLLPGEAEARLLAGHLRPQGAAAAAGGAPAKPSQVEVKAGMTPLEVLDALGKPEKELTAGAQSKWVYPELTVIFENGRVKEARF